MNADIPVLVADGIRKRFVLHADRSIKDRALSLVRRSKMKSKTDFWALDGVSATINLGETVGLIGHNGSGKSTLLKVLGGILDPTNGSVMRRGRVAALLELGAGFHPDLTGRENVFLNAAILGMTRREIEDAFDDILEFSGIGDFIDTQVKFYSSGMYVRLAFAVAVHSDPDILLVDEVLAVGDEPFQIKCLTKIRQFQREGRTIILVSHSAEQVADICTRAIVLDGGRVVHDGEVAEAIRVLRDGYERDRKAEVEHTGEASPIEILGVAVTSADGDPLPSPVIPGSDMVITLSTRVNSEIDWIAGFTLSTSMGQPVYRLNSEGIGMALPTSPGDWDISFTVLGTNFGTNRLILSAGATDSLGRPLASVDPAAHLDFDVDPAGAGYVQFPASGSLSAR